MLFKKLDTNTNNNERREEKSITYFYEGFFWYDHEQGFHSGDINHEIEPLKSLPSSMNSEVPFLEKQR